MIESCPSNCNEGGECIDGKCKCDEYHTGFSCAYRQCKNKCNSDLGQGKCIEGEYTCKCNSGFSGEDCSINNCPNNCSVSSISKSEVLIKINAFQTSSLPGVCTSTGCKCNKGFSGEDCSLILCPSSCSNNGDCNFNLGKCECYEGYSGDDCSITQCKDNCSDKGECIKDKCVCSKGYEGFYCQKSTF